METRGHEANGENEKGKEMSDFIELFISKLRHWLFPLVIKPKPREIE